MKVMVSGVSMNRQYTKSYTSFRDIKIRKGDGMWEQTGTRGDVARSIIGEKFLESDFDALLMCDLDQVFPEDTLEILREHDLDMESEKNMTITVIEPTKRT